LREFRNKLPFKILTGKPEKDLKDFLKKISNEKLNKNITF